MPDSVMTAPIALSKEQLTEWMDCLEQARSVRKQVQAWWDTNIEAYAPKPSEDPSDYGTKLSTNRDFTLVERKKADLFYQVPDVQAIPQPLMVGAEAILDTHTAILNAKLGIYGVDGKDLAHRVLFDVLCPAGTGWTVMGYEQTSVTTPTLDPMMGQMVNVPVPVHSDVFWRWVSPRQALIPASFRSTRWDDAPWLGFEFEWPKAAAKAKGWIGDDYEPAQSDTELYFDYGLGNAKSDDCVRGTVIFYKSNLFRDDRPHPLHQSMLVFIDGVEQPVEHKDSPYQTLTPQGKLTPDSLIGFPIHPLTIRPMSDTAYVPSDCTISRPIVNELNRLREQGIEESDANLQSRIYNTGVIPQDALEKAVKSPIGGFIGLPSEAFDSPDHGFAEIPPIPQNRTRVVMSQMIDADLARTHAIDANQAGADAGGDQTATEASLRQSNTNARLGLERGVVLDWWVKGCAKFSTLIQRFLTLEEAAAIVGPQKAQAWDQWRHQVPAALAFKALPDASQRNDLVAERKRALDEYSFFAKDPKINAMALLEHLLPKMHYPKEILNTQPPTQKPEPPKISLAIGAADLDPMNPAYGNIYQILTQQGVQNLAQPTVDPMTAHAMQAAQQAEVAAAKHPGKLAPAESLSKHQTDQTGGMQGSGDMGVM